MSWLILVLEKCRPKAVKCFELMMASRNAVGKASLRPECVLLNKMLLTSVNAFGKGIFFVMRDKKGSSF